jgi:hypothetical protein
VLQEEGLLTAAADACGGLGEDLRVPPSARLAGLREGDSKAPPLLAQLRLPAKGVIVGRLDDGVLILM